jgi:hypothetical protein
MTLTPGQCGICNVKVTQALISCNPDGTVHWQATIHNSNACPVQSTWETDLEIRKTNGHISTVAVLQGVRTFPPGDTVVTGDFCYVFSRQTDAIRVEFELDGALPSCEPTRKSTFINPCRPTPSCPNAPADLSPDGPYYDAAMGLLARGALSRYSDGTFHPDQPATRAELIRALVVALRLPLPPAASLPGPTFRDVPATDLFYPYIETAYQQGWISGYTDGTFRPDQAVTRGQASRIVVTAAHLPLAAAAKPAYADVPASSPIYPYVATASAQGLISGYPDGTFQPDAALSRGALAQMLDALAAAPPETPPGP